MKRLKKILKWTGVIIAVLVAIALVANAWFVGTTGSRLDAQVAAIRAVGDPVTIAELAPPPAPPAENAATYLQQAEPAIDAIHQALEGVFEHYRPGWAMSPEDQAVVRKAFAAHPEVLPLLEKAAACPAYRVDRNYSAPPDEFLTSVIESTRTNRAIIRILSFRATMLTAAGDRDEALRTALLMLRLNRQFEREPTLMSYLVANAVRVVAAQAAAEVLEAGPVSAELRDALEAELADIASRADFDQAMRGERAYMVSSLRTFPGANSWFLGRGIANKLGADCLEAFARFEKVANQPDAFREMQQFDGSELSVLAGLLLPAYKAAFTGSLSSEAAIRSLRVLNALQRYEAAHGDRRPELGELGLPKETTTDPFKGEPLKLVKSPDGWIVYSVGPNLVDDGGKLGFSSAGENTDLGVGPLSAQATESAGAPPAEKNPSGAATK